MIYDDNSINFARLEKVDLNALARSLVKNVNAQRSRSREGHRNSGIHFPSVPEIETSP